MGQQVHRDGVFCFLAVLTFHSLQAIAFAEFIRPIWVTFVKLIASALFCSNLVDLPMPIRIGRAAEPVSGGV
jgi:hypothetical protein